MAEPGPGERKGVHGVAPAPPESAGGRGWLVCGGLGLGAILLLLAVALPNLIEARKHGAESPAIGALKTISTSQSLFREGDKDQDGVYDYGTLAELSQQELIDAALGSGAKHGYLYDAWPSPSTPEFLWFAIANPATHGETGDRYFCTNHAGVIHYRLDRPFTRAEIGPGCEIPAGALPVGK